MASKSGGGGRGGRGGGGSVGGGTLADFASLSEKQQTLILGNVRMMRSGRSRYITYDNMRESGYSDADIRALNKSGFIRISDSYSGGTRYEFTSASKLLASDETFRRQLLDINTATKRNSNNVIRIAG